MSRRPAEEPERIAVAAPRPPSRPPAPARGRPAGSASDAGLALLVVIGLLAAVGWLAGGPIGARFAGGLIGGFAGAIAGFTLLYMRYRDL